MSRIRIWVYLTRLTWRTSPGRCLACLLSFLPGIIGAPLLALLMRDFTNHLLAGRLSQAASVGVAAAAVWIVADQSDDIRSQLRNDVRERVWARLSAEILLQVGEISGIEHLEDPNSLDRIETVVRRSNTISDTVWAAAETVANVLAVVATLAVLTTISPLLLLTLPLAMPTLWFNKVGRTRARRAMSEAAEGQRTADRLLEVLFDPTAAIEVRAPRPAPRCWMSMRRDAMSPRERSLARRFWRRSC
jgi:ATP-binding cassette subfamily B protein